MPHSDILILFCGSLFQTGAGLCRVHTAHRSGLYGIFSYDVFHSCAPKKISDEGLKKYQGKTIIMGSRPEAIIAEDSYRSERRRWAYPGDARGRVDEGHRDLSVYYAE